MRMSKEGIQASDIINNYSAEKLSDIIYNFGDEYFQGELLTYCKI